MCVGYSWACWRLQGFHGLWRRCAAMCGCRLCQAANVYLPPLLTHQVQVLYFYFKKEKHYGSFEPYGKLMLCWHAWTDGKSSVEVPWCSTQGCDFQTAFTSIFFQKIKMFSFWKKNYCWQNLKHDYALLVIVPDISSSTGFHPTVTEQSRHLSHFPGLETDSSAPLDEFSTISTKRWAKTCLVYSKLHERSCTITQ